MTKTLNILFIIVFVFLLSSCVSRRFVYQSESPYVSCKLRVLTGGADKQRVDGVVQLYKDSLLQISFRAPVVKSELALLFYTPADLVVIDRVNKVYGKASYPIDLIKGITVYSFEEIQQKIISASQSNNKSSYYLASKFGWDILNDATVKLFKFSNSPFNLRSSRVSKRYTEVSLQEMLQALDL